MAINLEDDDLSLEMLGSVTEEGNETPEEGEGKNTTIEDEEGELFPEEPDKTPEEVGGGSQESKTEKEDTKPGEGSSPNNIYSSIAESLRKEGILTLDDKYFTDIKDGFDLGKLFQAQVDSMQDERAKQINDALNAGVQPDEIKQYQQVLGYLNGVTEESVREETQDAESLRGNIIYQDYINRGFTPERANKEVKKSFDAGTDVDDALESLEANKEFFTSQYNTVVKAAQTAKDNQQKAEREQFKQIEKKFNETEEPIKGLKLSEQDRKKLLTQYTRFVAKDNWGRPVNELGKYAIENPTDYQYNINLIYYLTNGFKDIQGLIGKEVKNKTKSALSDLEKVIRNPSNNLTGSDFGFGNDTNPESRKGLSVVFD